MSVIADCILKIATNEYVFAVFVIFSLVRSVLGHRIAPAIGLYISLLISAGCLRFLGMLFPVSTQIIVIILLALVCVCLGQPMRKRKGK